MPIDWSVFKNLKGKLREEKGLKWVMILGVIGIVLLAASSFTPQKKTENTVAEQTTKQYCEEIETKLSALLRDMQGVGRCQVYVTLENGVEYVYATEEKNNVDRADDGSKTSERNDTQTGVILIDGEEGETGLLLTEIQPQIKGVVVVCEGGDNAAVQERVTAVVTTALNISTRRVCVTK